MTTLAPVPPSRVTLIIEAGGERITYLGLMGTVALDMRWRTNPGRHPQDVDDLFSVGSSRVPEELSLSITDFQHDDENRWFFIKVEQLPNDLFEPAGPHSGKLRCKVCGRTGWPGVYAPWMASCLGGHPYPCSHCDRVFATRSARASHLNPRRKKAS